MDYIRQLGFDSARIFSSFNFDPERVLPIPSKERETLAHSGLGWTSQQYSSFQLACGILFGLGYSVVFTLLALIFGLDIAFLLVSIPCLIFGILASRLHVAGLARERERDVEANLLDALRHFASELKNGGGLVRALSSVGNGGYGAVSGLISEALVLVSEGESVEASFREAGERSPSTAFKSFAASVAHASSTGTDLSGIVERFARELEASRRSALAIYGNECSKLSTLTVVLTGVLPGMLVFALVESGFMFGFRVPVEFFLIAYLLAFPLAKYALQARLALSSPGI